MSEWSFHRTCSHSDVHCGNGHRALFGHYTRDGAMLCVECYEKTYEPKKYRERVDARERQEKRRAEIVADELERRKRGDPPAEGWERRGGLLVQKVTGDPARPGAIVGREIIEVVPALFDTETIKAPEKDSSISLFANYKSFVNPPRTDYRVPEKWVTTMLLRDPNAEETRKSRFPKRPKS